MPKELSDYNMKKILYTFLVILLFSGTVTAQLDSQRTLSTRIADLLASVPASGSEELEANAEEVAAMGEAGILELAGKLVPPGQGDNTAVEYALDGFTAYASQPGKESLRQLAARAYCSALEQVKEAESKAFLISQLQLVGSDESVPALQGYLGDEHLCGPAARTLAKIGTDEAGKALLQALEGAREASRLSIAEALGDMRYRPAAGALASLVSTGDTSLKKVGLYALAGIADPASEKLLAAAASRAGYAYEETEATAAYLAYLRRLAETGNRSRAEKSARVLLKRTEKAGQVHTQTAALTLLAGLRGEKSIPMLLKAAGSGNAEYREAALKLGGKYDQASGLDGWLRLLKKADPETKAAVIAMLGNTGREGALPVVLEHLGHTDQAVRLAAVKAAQQLGQMQSLDPLLGLMRQGDTTEVDAVKQALLTMKGEGLPALIGKVVPDMPAGAQAALIGVLGSRAAAGQSAVVLAQVNNPDTVVSKAAFAALPAVVNPDDLPALFSLLTTVEKESAIKAVQEAVAAALEGDASRKTALVLAEQAKAPADRQARFLPVLASIGGEEALHAVTAVFETGPASGQKAALNALSAWKDAGAAPALLKICRETGNGAYLDQALRGYVRLAAASDYPDDRKLEMLQEAMRVAQQAEQKQLILKEVAGIHTMPSLLFAGRYLDQAEVQQAAAAAVHNIALSNKNFYGSDVRALLEKTLKVLQGQDSDYLKEAIRKHLAEMPPGEPGSGPFTLSEEEKKEGFQVLFDGTSLDQWTGNTEGYVIENGNLVIHPDKGNGNLFTRKEYSNFIYRFEFQLTPGANNGLGIRAPLEGDAAYTGMELQILDNKANVYKDLKEYQYHGSVYGVIPAKRGYLKPAGEWNYQEVIARGSRIKVILNGTTILDGDIAEASKNGTMDHRDHPGLRRTSGHIGFLGHGSVVRFRNIRVKEL